MGKIPLTNEIVSFALGSANLYETLNRNTDFQCLPVDHTNPPHIIMQNERGSPSTAFLRGTPTPDRDSVPSSSRKGAYAKLNTF